MWSTSSILSAVNTVNAVNQVNTVQTLCVRRRRTILPAGPAHLREEHRLLSICQPAGPVNPNCLYAYVLAIYFSSSYDQQFFCVICLHQGDESGLHE